MRANYDGDYHISWYYTRVKKFWNGFEIPMEEKISV